MQESNYLFTVHQFYVELRGIQGPIWRRIQVPKCGQGKLIAAILRSFGWTGGEMHGQPTTDTQRAIAVQDSSYRRPGGWISVKVSCRPRLRLQRGTDENEPWFFDAMFEGRLRLARAESYPRCIAGEMAAPLLDFMTPADYDLFLHIVSDPSHPLCEELLQTCGFDPEAFDAMAASTAMQGDVSNGSDPEQLIPSFAFRVLSAIFRPRPPWLHGVAADADATSNGALICEPSSTQSHPEPRAPAATAGPVRLAPAPRPNCLDPIWS